MPFSCFRRKSKNTYNLNHQHDRTLPYRTKIIDKLTPNIQTRDFEKNDMFFADTVSHNRSPSSLGYSRTTFGNQDPKSGTDHITEPSNKTGNENEFNKEFDKAHDMNVTEPANIYDTVVPKKDQSLLEEHRDSNQEFINRDEIDKEVLKPSQPADTDYMVPRDSHAEYNQSMQQSISETGEEINDRTDNAIIETETPNSSTESYAEFKEEINGYDGTDSDTIELENAQKSTNISTGSYAGSREDINAIHEIEEMEKTQKSEAMSTDSYAGTKEDIHSKDRKNSNLSEIEDSKKSSNITGNYAESKEDVNSNNEAESGVVKVEENQNSTNISTKSYDEPEEDIYGNFSDAVEIEESLNSTHISTESYAELKEDINANNVTGSDVIEIEKTQISTNVSTESSAESLEELTDDNLQKDEGYEDGTALITFVSNDSLYQDCKINTLQVDEIQIDHSERYSTDSALSERKSIDMVESTPKMKRRSGLLPKQVHFDEETAKSLVKYPKSASEENFIKDAIAKNEFLSKVITGRRLQDVVDAMYIKEVRSKEKLIKEGQTGSHMYVAAEGEFEVTKKGKGLVNVIKPGEVFGELAILYNAKRLASVRSSTVAKVWVIDGTVYQQIMKRWNIEEQDEILSFLQDVPILNEAGEDVLRKVANLLKPEFYETGTVIVREGDRGDKFYIISAGSVTVTREEEGFISQLHKGKCFGEKALLESITRQATVTADAPGTECLTLTQKHFISHFGRIEDISMITMPPQAQIIIEDVKVDNEYSNLDLTEFKSLKTLGVGGFGRVEFLQHKEDPSLTFALKYLKKYEMVQQDQQYHVINEMQIQMACNSPFIIRMYKTFKDNKYIYFLMEVCLGGDLWSLLQKQPNKRFEERGARFIAGCVLEALGFLHERGIVYRDLKPENLLIGNNGYIKMTDFGFAKRLAPHSKSGTFAGTPEYVAPEIILNRGHDKAVDYWAYGIFIYELLNGRTPFRSSDPSYMRTYNNILSGLDIVIFPSHNNPKAKNLITKLLKKSPEERLGCLRGGVDDIRNHKWFSDLDWEKLKECKISSPYKPKLASNVDFSRFDHFKRDTDIPPDEVSGWDEYF